MSKLLVILALAACAPPAQGGYYQQQPAYGAGPTAAPQARAVTINGAALTPNEAQTLAQLEASYQVTLPDGAYWYDATSGAFGLWGRPTGAVIPAGLDLGPPLPAEASSGTTGVFINNRQLQPSEVQYLSNLVGAQLQVGRYFLDANGNAGTEGGPVEVNLVQVANARRAARGGNRNTGGGGGGRHITAGSGSSTSWFDSDGSGCKVFMASNGSTISSGC